MSEGSRRAEKITAPSLAAMRKAGQKIVAITAYDAAFGELADQAGVDIVLVGDSVGNVLLGYSSTIPVSLQEMAHHTRATRAGVKRALLVADLPFGSYQASVEQAVQSAVILMKAGAEAVKLEGNYPDTVRAFTNAGIPTMGHVGMTPQSINRFGGHRVQGKGETAQEVLTVAREIDDSGAIAIVLELIPSALAREITQAVGCPTIGIGAGEGCSGQIQVLHDVIGLSGHKFHHAKPYFNGRSQITEAMRRYAQEVRDGTFPDEEQSF